MFDRYHQDLYRYCAAILGSAEDAQDAVQNTMLKVLRALPGEERDLKLKPWLYRIAYNEAIDMVRARKSTEPVEVESLVGRSELAQEVEARDRLRQLISDIAELPDRQRGALVMREMGGLSFEEIGAALQTSPSVARQTLYEARLGLKQMSEGREMPCEEVMRAISSEDGRILRRRDIRAHLLQCRSCQAFRAEISDRRHELAAFAPLPAAVSAGMLQSLLGGTAGGSGAMAGAAGAAAGKTLIGSTAIKSAAAVCAVGAVGVIAANDGRLIHPDSGSRDEPPAGTAVGQPSQNRGFPAATRGSARREALSAGKPRLKARQSIRQASIADPTAPRAKIMPSEGTNVKPGSSESNGKHLGRSKNPSHAASHDKPAHPSKGKKDPGAIPPGELKSPGGAKHVATGKTGQRKPPERPPPHPPEPARPDQSPAPDTTTAPAAAAESGNPKPGKAVAE